VSRGALGCSPSRFARVFPSDRSVVPGIQRQDLCSKYAPLTCPDLIHVLGSTTSELRENALPYLAVVGDGTAWPLEWSLFARASLRRREADHFEEMSPHWCKRQHRPQRQEVLHDPSTTFNVCAHAVPGGDRAALTRWWLGSGAIQGVSRHRWRDCLQIGPVVSSTGVVGCRCRALLRHHPTTRGISRRSWRDQRWRAGRSGPLGMSVMDLDWRWKFGLRWVSLDSSR
jgi:hypothetical protein